jgi:transposase InsO family protein
MYLAVIINLYSRQVVGWSMITRMTATLVCDAPSIALFRRGMSEKLLSASSGKTTRHRLNRGGCRSANNALWTVAMLRMHMMLPERKTMLHGEQLKDYQPKK